MQRLKNVHLENRTIFSHTIKLENFFLHKVQKTSFYILFSTTSLEFSNKNLQRQPKNVSMQSSKFPV